LDAAQRVARAVLRRRCYQRVGRATVTPSVAFVAVALFWQLQLATGHDMLCHLRSHSNGSSTSHGTSVPAAQPACSKPRISERSASVRVAVGILYPPCSSIGRRRPCTLPLWMPRFRPHIEPHLPGAGLTEDEIRSHGFSVFRQSSLCFVRYLVISWVLSTLGTWVWVYA
jgi:hypothetical protein